VINLDLVGIGISNEYINSENGSQPVRRMRGWDVNKEKERLRKGIF
jgi:hypothetical protein